MLENMTEYYDRDLIEHLQSFQWNDIDQMFYNSLPVSSNYYDLSTMKNLYEKQTVYHTPKYTIAP